MLRSFLVRVIPTPVLLLVLVLLGLPASPGALAAVSEGAALPDPRQPGQSGEQAGIPVGDIAQAWAESVRQAAAMRRILAERDVPAALSLAVLARHAGGEEDGEEDLSRWVAALGAPAMARCRGLEDPVEATLCTVETLGPLLPGDERASLVEEAGTLMQAWLEPGRIMPPGVFPRTGGAELPGIRPGGGEGLRFGPLQELLSAALLPVVGMGGELDEDAAALSRALQVLAGFEPGAEIGEVLASVPELRQLVRRHGGLSSLERAIREGRDDLLLEGDRVLADYRAFLGAASGEARSFITGVGAANVRDLGSIARDPLRDLLGRVSAEVDRPVDWASERAFTHLLSGTATLAGLEASVTERIRELGGSAVDLRHELRAFAGNRRELGPQLAVSLLSGNALGVASGVAGFLGLTAGGLDAEAARDLREIRSMVESLSGQVDEGFQAVDARFDEVLEELDRGLARMEVLVASGQQEIRSELQGVREELDRVAGRIDRLDANLVTYLEAGFDRDHARTLVRCLEHRDRHVPPFDRMPFEVFSDCLADMRTRGTRDARDALLTDRTTPTDDASLLQALADTSTENLARRLPLLARAAEQRLGWGGLRGGRGGANPVEWTVAAQAYLSLLRDWPLHARGVSTGDLEALQATGIEVAELLRALRQDPVSREAGGAIGAALRAYEAAADDLTREAELLARRHEQAQLRRVDPASVLDRMRSDPRSDLPELDPPVPASATIPRALRTATVLALEEPEFVYRTDTEEMVELGEVRRRWILFGRRHERTIRVRTRMEVELRLGSGETVARWTARGPGVLAAVEEVSGPHGSDRVRNRDVRVEDPARHFLETRYPALAGEPLEWSSIPVDPALVARLEEDIEAELRRSETVALGRVFESVCHAHGTPPAAGPDLPAADLQSVRRLEEALDRMTLARTLLAAFVRLGLPEAAMDEPALPALLHGPDGLPDRAGLCRTVQAGESPLRLVWLEETPRTRALEVGELVSAAMEATRSREAAGVGGGIVEATLGQVEAALRLQRARIAAVQSAP